MKVRRRGNTSDRVSRVAPEGYYVARGGAGSKIGELRETWQEAGYELVIWDTIALREALNEVERSPERLSVVLWINLVGRRMRPGVEPE